MPPIVGTYELNYLTHWRNTRAASLLTTFRILGVGMVVAGVAVAVRSQPLPLRMQLFSVGVAVAALPVVYVASLVAMSAVVTFVTRLSSNAWRGQHHVAISEAGVRLTSSGRDMLIPWRSVEDVRVVERTLLLRTDEWIPIPGQAFGSRGALQEVRARCASLQGTSRATHFPQARAAPATPLSTETAYAPPQAAETRPPTAVPPRGADVLVRLSIPPGRLSWSGAVLKMVRYRPQAVLPLAVATVAPAIVMPTHRAGLVAGLGSLLFVLWRRNVARREAMRGLPEVIDVKEDGIEDWEVMRQTQFRWGDVIKLAEDSAGFIVISRGGEFLILPRDCVEGGDVEQLRAILQQRVAGAARTAG